MLEAGGRSGKDFQGNGAPFFYFANDADTGRMFTHEHLDTPTSLVRRLASLLSRFVVLDMR